MNVSVSNGPRSTIDVSVELSADELRQAIDEGVRHLGRRTRVPGFRPGKVPRPMLERALGVRRDDPDAPNPIYDEAREHLYERTILSIVRESEHDVLELPARPEWTDFEEGVGAGYRVTLPVRPEVTLGDYRDYPFTPQVEPITDDRVAAVLEQLREQHASLVPVEDRGAQEGDFAVVAFEGRRGGEPVPGASADRFPLVIGRERMVPGFEQQLVGMEEGTERAFGVTFPDDYAEADLAGQEVEFTVTLRELRERRMPPLDDDLAGIVGPYADLDALRVDVRARLGRSSLNRARHAFADRIIEYATGNASVEIPDLLVDREVEVMIDEMRVSLARQGIGFEDYLRVAERDEATVRADARPQAAHRVKVLLVLGAVADREEVTVPESAVDAEVERVRSGEGARSRLTSFVESDRGRSYIRSQLRRAQTVEALIDRWIETHPAYADVQHVHDGGAAGVEALGADDEGGMDADGPISADGLALAAVAAGAEGAPA